MDSTCPQQAGHALRSLQNDVECGFYRPSVSRMTFDKKCRSRSPHGLVLRYFGNISFFVILERSAAPRRDRIHMARFAGIGSGWILSRLCLSRMTLDGNVRLQTGLSRFVVLLKHFPSSSSWRELATDLSADRPACCGQADRIQRQFASQEKVWDGFYLPATGGSGFSTPPE